LGVVAGNSRIIRDADIVGTEPECGKEEEEEEKEEGKKEEVLCGARGCTKELSSCQRGNVLKGERGWGRASDASARSLKGWMR